MIKLEISVIPKAIKRVEFSQSLSSLQVDLQRCCPNLEITVDNNVYSFSAAFTSGKQLKEVLSGKEFGILSGAISTLGEKSDIDIQGIKYKKWGPNLRDIQLT